MSENTCPCDIIDEEEEEDRTLTPTDDISDSTSSYCTALCSLSDFGEVEEPNDKPCPEPQPLVLAPLTPPSPQVSDAALLLELCITNLTEEGKSTDGSGETSDKTFAPKKRDTLSGTVVGTLTDTDTNEGPQSSQPRFTSKTILIRPKVNQTNQDRGQEHMGRKPNEDSITHGRKHGKGPSICDTESKLLSRHPVDGGQEEEGEGLGLDCMGASNREEQTELSLRARNRKAPASCISTLTAGELQSGIPACCYLECSLATGQQHQRQRPPGSQSLPTDSQQDTWRSRPLPQKPCRSTWRLQGILQHSGEPSTMTTKFYEADRDLAFSKHYCPQADYLDVYTSNCRSLTQPSTVSDWSEDDISLQLSSVVSANIQSTTACSETGSFECIDVAMENQGEVYKGGTKTVPKRQIQLKRRKTAESQDSDKGEVTNEVQCTPTTASHRRDVFMRQHSTPAAFHQESHGMESENRSAQAERKQRLQKSMSLDETSTKTKMASCIIKSVLSKKMQCELNLQNSEMNEGAFAPVEVQNNGKNCHRSPLAAKEINTTDMSSVDSHSQIHSIQYHQVASAKTHQKLLYKQNSISLVSSFGGSEFQSTSPKTAEIATALVSEEIERQHPRDGVLPYANRSPADRLSCDSAKGKTWSTCAGSSRSGGKQAPVKNTPEECNRGQGVHKQHNPLPKALQRTDTLWGSQDSQQPLIPEGVSGKETETGDRGEVKFAGQSGNTGTQEIFKAKAPVHVVRDVRRLVKNTYNLSFKNAGDTVSGEEDSPLSFYQQSTYDQVSHRESCGVRAVGQNEKLFVKKVSPPVPLKVVDTALLYTAPKGYVTKVTALHESQDRIPNTGFTNITPQSLAKPIGKTGNQLNINRSDNLGSSANTTSKYPNRQTWSSVEPPSKSNQQRCERTGTTFEKQKSTQATATNSCTLVPTYYSSAAHLYQPEQYQPSVTTCSSAKDSSQNQGPPPRSQGQTTLTCTPSPACVQLNTTGTPQRLMSPFFYTPNPMNYQTIQTHVGKMSFIQAPVLMQPPPQNQPVQLLRGEIFSPPQPAGNRENKMSSPDTKQQQYLCSTQGFMTPFSTECRQGSAGLAYPEMAGGQVYGQGPRHMLMDPETGRYFYVDVPQLPPQPQRKMLFDPETCQYVEVLLPQQTVPTAVLPPACAMPYHSLQFPAMYPPKGFSVQAHPQEMPHTRP